MGVPITNTLGKSIHGRLPQEKTIWYRKSSTSGISRRKETREWKRLFIIQSDHRHEYVKSTKWLKPCRIIQFYPQPILFLISGYSSIQRMITLINKPRWPSYIENNEKIMMFHSISYLVMRLHHAKHLIIYRKQNPYERDLNWSWPWSSLPRLTCPCTLILIFFLSLFW